MFAIAMGVHVPEILPIVLNLAPHIGNIAGSKVQIPDFLNPSSLGLPNTRK